MEKKTFDIDNFFDNLSEQVAKDIAEGTLGVKERAKLFADMLPYKFPKLQQVESKNTTKQIVIFGDVGDTD